MRIAAELFKRAIAIIMIIFSVWLMASYAEILIKNTHENPEYSKWNFFITTMEKTKDM